MLRVGLNGFGRIGRAIFRQNIERKAFEVVAINERNPDIANIAYTLNYDTLYERLPEPYSVDGTALVSPSGSRVAVVRHESIAEVEWSAHDVDVVIDASGVHANVLAARRLLTARGMRRVFVTHSPEEVDFTMVLGANEQLFDPDRHRLVSTSICDATAIAPVMRLLHAHATIASGYATTVHPWLNYQNLMDGPASSWSVPGTIYHHYALGRSAIGSLIPKPTTALTATCKVLEHVGIRPGLVGSFSLRPPTAIVGMADLTLCTERNVSAADIVALYEDYERDQRWKILHNTREPLVSSDFKRLPYSAAVDHRWTDVVGGHMVKLVLWYDNEFGYASKVIDQVVYAEALAAQRGERA